MQLITHFNAVLLLFCVLPLGYAADSKLGKEHIQMSELGHMVYNDKIETVCTNTGMTISAGLISQPPNSEISNSVKPSATMVNGTSIIHREDFDKRRTNLTERLRAHARTACERINDELHDELTQANRRPKRAVGAMLGLAGFATAAAALGWDAYQQMEIARHEGQLTAEGALNADLNDMGGLMNEKFGLDAKSRQLRSLDEYLQYQYDQLRLAIDELANLRVRYDQINSVSLKMAVKEYSESVFAKHNGQHSRIISSRTTVTTQGCTDDNEIRYRICLHYAPKTNDADLIQVLDYGRFVMERSAFARIDIHHQWIHQDEKWSTASLVECEPDGRRVWLCPAHAIKERDICTPSDVNRCSIDVYKVNDTFVELFDWADGHMVATNVKDYTVQRSDGKVLTKQVPSTGVFFLRVPKNSTVIIGDKKIPGNNQLRMKVEPMEPTLMQFDEAELEQEFAALQKRGIKLTVKIDSDGRAYATAAGANSGLFGTIFGFFEQFQHALMVVPIVMGIIALLLLSAYCGCTPATCLGWLRHCCCACGGSDKGRVVTHVYKPAMISSKRIINEEP